MSRNERVARVAATEILDEVTEIDARWKAVGEGAESVSIRLEATDVRVTSARLVWVPTA